MFARAGQQERSWKFFLVSLFLLGSLRCGLAALEWGFADEIHSVTHFPSSSQVFDRHGELLYEYFGDIRRIPVSREAIPDFLRQATLFAEDERFFSHAGFDPIGIVRALWNNMQEEENQRQGASTLGQQLVKNTVLGRSRSYIDKVKEIMLSVAVDAHYSKDDILHLYLNTIPYGSNVYGVETASRLYFRKSVHQLTLREAATLAALPKHPSYLSPYGENVGALMERRDYVLGKMKEASAITSEQYEQAIAEATHFAANEMPILAPHFVMDVRAELEQAIGREALETEGLIITTTLDLGAQKMAEGVVADKASLFTYTHAANVGALVMHPASGEILAMVGNRDYFDEAHDGNFNMTTALRQPGSTFKPVAYATLLDRQEVTPATVLLDVKKDYGTKEEPYVPRNYDGRYRGAITLRDALAQSLNVPAVNALTMAGIDQVIDQAESMGVTTMSDRRRFGPSLVLGGAEVSLLEMAGVYGTFANSGVYVEPRRILAVTRDGKHFWNPDYAAPAEVLSAEAAYQISSILSDRYARAPIFGTRGSLAFADRPVAVKTGTTTAYRDAWTIGYTPSLVVGVWVGNADNTPLRAGSAGAMAAAPIWRGIIDGALADTPVEAFEPSEQLRLVSIPTVFGPRQEYVAPWQYTAPPLRRFAKTTMLETRQ